MAPMALRKVTTVTLAPRPRLRSLGAGLAASALLLTTGATLQAHAAPTPEVVATGLNNPRQLDFSPTGDLFIAEAGLGSNGDTGAPSIPGPEGGRAYFGLTGSITRVTASGVQERVLDGLPSVAAADGSGAQGPTDVDLQGAQRYVVSIGLGADPSARAGLGPVGAGLATLQTGTFGSRPRVVADLGAFEGASNPDGDLADSNPGGLVRTYGGYAVADAGGNSLVSVAAGGKVSTIATFGSSVPTAKDRVPTSVTVGPDGAYYVSELTGGPFAAGESRVYRVVRGQAPTVYASGLTHVTDLAWHDGHLYAVQLSDTALFSGPPGGSLVKVAPSGGTHQPVLGELQFPYGVAFHGDAAYVTEGAMSPGGGRVLKVSVAD